MRTLSQTLISAKLTSKNSNKFKIKHRLHTFIVAIFQYGWSSCIHHRSNHIAEIFQSSKTN